VCPICPSSIPASGSHNGRRSPMSTRGGHQAYRNNRSHNRASGQRSSTPFANHGSFEARVALAAQRPSIVFVRPPLRRRAENPSKRRGEDPGPRGREGTWRRSSPSKMGAKGLKAGPGRVAKVRPGYVPVLRHHARGLARRAGRDARGGGRRQQASPLTRAARAPSWRSCGGNSPCSQGTRSQHRDHGRQTGPDWKATRPTCPQDRPVYPKTSSKRAGRAARASSQTLLIGSGRWLSVFAGAKPRASAGATLNGKIRGGRRGGAGSPARR